MFQIIALLTLLFWIAFVLLITLVLWIAIFGDHGNEIIMVLVQRTDEVETGIPSEHDGKNKLYPLLLLYLPSLSSNNKKSYANPFYNKRACTVGLTAYLM